MKKNYQWKIASLAKGVDVNEVQAELDKIQKKHGILTPKIIVEESQKRKSILHSLFEWDDSIAAQQYRLQQARILLNNIQINILSDGEERTIDVYEIVPKGENEERQYKHIESFTQTDIEYIRNTTLESLKQINHKLKIYKNFDAVLEHLQNAISVLETIN